MSSEAPSANDRGTPVSVAYDLMRDILFDDPSRPQPDSPEFRAYVLDLYAECLLAVRGKRRPPAAAHAEGRTRSAPAAPVEGRLRVARA
jgi:hypothetical protein